MGKKKVGDSFAEKKPDQESSKLKKHRSDQKTYELTFQKAAIEPNDGILKVVLNTELEAVMIDLIQKASLFSSNTKRFSQRLTARKLTDMYESLRGAKFQSSQIEQAMSAVVKQGGDVLDALDWLCLHLSNDQLPDGFSSVLHREEVKHHRSNQPTFIAQTDSSKQEVSTQLAQFRISDDAKEESCKRWILDYVENSAESAADVPKTMDESDINERYLELEAHYLDARTEASMLKETSNDTAQIKVLSRKIGSIVRDMKMLEKHPNFDPRIKFHDISVETGSEAAAEETSACAMLDDEGLPSLFDEAAAVAVVANDNDQLSSVSSSSIERRCFAYTRQQWTGKSPKQFLHDWTRKNLPSTTSMSFERIDAGGGWWRTRCKITRKTKEGDLLVCPEIACDNLKDAEHLASTLALYNLCKGQRIHTLLPPPYRDVWLEWQTAESEAKKKVEADDVKPRDQFVQRLLASLNLDEPNTIIPPEVATPSSKSRSSDVVCDSWEDIDSFEVEDVNEKVTAEFSETSKESRRLSREVLQKIFHRNRQTGQYQKLFKERQKLPVYAYCAELQDVFEQERVFIVAGETGSGKSTQVPQIILERMLSSLATNKSEMPDIICTEPRRISAVSLAERVSAELGELSGPGRKDSLCGYRIRFESRCSQTTRLTYCTTGILLRQLQTDPSLKHVGCVIVDEVHERSVETDFLLIHLRQLLVSQPELRVVLMSATLDAEKLSSYFGGCRVVSVPGKLFPVEIYHLEDVIAQTNYELDEDSPYCFRLDHLLGNIITQQFIETERAVERNFWMERTTLEVTGARGNVSRQSVEWTKCDLASLDQSGLDANKYTLKVRNTITRLNPKRVNIELILQILQTIVSHPEFSSVPGAVLVFLPGFAHIQNLLDLLKNDRNFSNTARYKLLVLHSALSSSEQAEVFLTPPAGVRKIVLSTNIAETGVTIPDVVFVIDSGKVKENQYSETTQMSQLVEVPISKASADQRLGRAGRVREGYCFRLFTRPAYEQLTKHSVPEILRVPLEELCLHILKCGLGQPAKFLSTAMDPPSMPAINRAMSILTEVGACIWNDTEPSLTPLGQHLANLPVNVRLGKMLIYAAMFGCLEPASIIAASLMDKSPFISSFETHSQSSGSKPRLSVKNSDHLTLYRAFIGWQAARDIGGSAAREYCEKNGLKQSSLVEIDNVSRDLVKVLRSSGFDADLSSILTRRNSKNLSSAFQKVIPTNSQSVSAGHGQLTQGLAAILMAALTAGLYPRLAQVSFRPPVDMAVSSTKEFCTARTSQGDAQIHTKSVNRYLAINGLVVYHEKVRSSQCVYLRDVSVVGLYPVLLFGGDIDIQHQQQTLTVDQWITMKAPARVGVIFKHIRRLIDELLLKKLENPAMDLSGELLIQTVIELLVTEMQSTSQEP